MSTQRIIFAVFTTIAISWIVVVGLGFSTKPPAKQGLLRGYVYTSIILANDNTNRQVFLPDVNGAIFDSLNIKVDTFKTDLDGAYTSKILPYGTYTIRLSKLGYGNTTYKTTIKRIANHPGPLQITLTNRDFVYGKVKLTDNKPGFFANAVFNQRFHTDITARIGDSQISTERCNIFGEYVLPNVKQSTAVSLNAVCQNAVVNRNITNNGTMVNLTLPSVSPRIRAIAAFNAANTAIQRTTPGAKITLRAEATDGDGHSLNYIWVPSGSFPGSTIGSGNTISWQLPNKAGNYQVFLLVYDKFGGVAYQPYNIIAGDERVRFSGVVKDVDGGSVVTQALIRINGQDLGRTDSRGYFSVSIPQGTGRRYVLNVEKQGYMLHSTIYFNDATEQLFNLVKATVKQFNPATDIVLTETEDRFTKFKKVIRQKDFFRSPAKVKIPKNSIVDAQGRRVSENVFISIRNVELFDSSRNFMPGDYGAIQDDVQKRLESFGAVDVQIRSSSNPTVKYKLSPTASAEITIPIGSSIVATAPNDMVLWDYDETLGVWKDIGKVSKIGNSFVGKTNRFSTLNADVAFNDATCIQLLDNPANPLSPGQLVNVTVTIPVLGSAPKVKVYNNLSVTDLPLVIVRLPPNTNVTIEVRTTSGTLISTQVVPTRNAIPGPANLNPDPPYTYCNDAYLKPPPLPSAPEGVFLSRITTADLISSEKYFQLIGAIGGSDYNGDGVTNNSDRITLNIWKQRNGFNTGDDVNAVYFNAGDLAFWRGMHQKNSGTGGSNKAFYVSNFTRDIDANDDMAAPSPNAIATVAMEYSPIVIGSNPVTKFYAFNSAGDLINAADLDGYGPKFLPGLCVECHGGEEKGWNSFATGADLQLDYDLNPTSNHSFLPFDVSSFRFSNKPGFLIANMEPNLRLLNERVLTTNPTQAIIDFIKASYNTTSSTLPPVPFNPNALVSGWDLAGNVNGVVIRDFYTQVVGKSCRTCHVSRSDDQLWFDSSTKFSGNVFQGAVCGTGKYMPNAKVTFVNFWTSTAPHQPQLLHQFRGFSGTCN